MAQWCVAVWRGASWCSAFWGLLHPAGGHCSSWSCSLGPGSCSCRIYLSLQEKLVFSQPPAMGLSVSANLPRAGEGRGGQQGCSGDPGDGGCPPMMPQGSCWLAAVPWAGPPMPPEQRMLRRRQSWQWSVLPPEKLLHGLGRAGQLQPLWEHSGKQGAFVCCGRAGLASCPVPTGPGCCLAGLACPALATQCYSVPIPTCACGRSGRLCEREAELCIASAVLRLAWLLGPLGKTVQPGAFCAWREKTP